MLKCSVIHQLKLGFKLSQLNPVIDQYHNPIPGNFSTNDPNILREFNNNRIKGINSWTTIIISLAQPPNLNSSLYGFTENNQEAYTQIAWTNDSLNNNPPQISFHIPEHNQIITLALDQNYQGNYINSDPPPFSGGHRKLKSAKTKLKKNKSRSKSRSKSKSKSKSKKRKIKKRKN